MKEKKKEKKKDKGTSNLKYPWLSAGAMEGGYYILCGNCHKRRFSKLPIPLDDYIEVLKEFVKKHKKCEEATTEAT